MFYGIPNQRGIAMLIEQALMVACVKIAGIEASIVSLLAVSITLCFLRSSSSSSWELILRPDAIKRLPDFAGQPTAFQVASVNAGISSASCHSGNVLYWSVWLWVCINSNFNNFSGIVGLRTNVTVCLHDA